MSDDPLKLYVVVMAILLCVLAFVAVKSYKESSAFERAVEEGPRVAKQFKTNASEVQTLCNQLSKSKLRKGYLSLIEDAAQYCHVNFVSLKPQNDKRLRGGGKERRFVFEFRKSGRAANLTRGQVANLCRTVEMYSQGVLKTIEVQLFRTAEPGAPAPGKEEIVKGDVYRGKVIFGLRVVE